MPSSLRNEWRRFLLCGVPLLVTACTLVGAGVQPPSVPPVAIEVVEVAAATASVEVITERERTTAQVVDVAIGVIGTPYRWGGTDANGFDCSGLIRFAYGEAGVAVPRTSAEQLRAGTPVELDPALLLTGDVLGFAGGADGRADHVGLHIGGDEFIHSSSSGVRISNLRDPYWRERLVAARRLVE
jgi:cell wall-associated NlpC family hydrolase